MKIPLYMFMVVALVHVSRVDGAEQGEWVSLFDGATLTGWQAREGKPPISGWVVEDGLLFRKGGGGDIVSAQAYENFELAFEWKISKKGNSGVKYRFQGRLGPEYQVLDDTGHSNGKNPFTSAAAMYLMAKPDDTQKVLKPVGGFNTGRIIANGAHLEHWLNGKKVLEMEVGSVRWNTVKAMTKFKGARGFGEGAGKILLQDHNDPVWYRNIRIRSL